MNGRRWPFPRAPVIMAAVSSAAHRNAAGVYIDDIATYLLRVDGRLSFERIAEEIGFAEASRSTMLKRLNCVCVALAYRDPKIEKIVRMARDTYREESWRRSSRHRGRAT